MDRQTREWLRLLERRIDVLERDDAEDDAGVHHEQNMRVSVVIGALCLLELITALWGVYEMIHHG